MAEEPLNKDELEAALDDTVADVELDESLDAPDDDEPGLDAGDAGSLDGSRLLEGFDPEAHYRNTAIQRKKIKQQVLSEGGQFVIGLLIGIVSLGAIILAITNQDLPYLIAAGVIAPPGLIYLLIRWRKWIGQAPYCYRLLTSLGEDADDLLASHSNKKMQKLQERLDQQVED